MFGWFISHFHPTVAVFAVVEISLWSLFSERRSFGGIHVCMFCPTTPFLLFPFFDFFFFFLFVSPHTHTPCGAGTCPEARKESEEVIHREPIGWLLTSVAFKSIVSHSSRFFLLVIISRFPPLSSRRMSSSTSDIDHHQDSRPTEHRGVGPPCATRRDGAPATETRADSGAAARDFSARDPSAANGAAAMPSVGGSSSSSSSSSIRHGGGGGGGHESSSAPPSVDEGGGLVGGLFSVRRPKHFGAGLVSGVKNIARGVAAGVAIFAVGTYQGGKKDGVVGALKGAAIGAVAFAGLAATGAVVGAKQVVHGVMSTPEALGQCFSNHGCWDEQERRWRLFDSVRRGRHVVPSSDDDIFQAVRLRKIAAMQKEKQQQATKEGERGDSGGSKADGGSSPFPASSQAAASSSVSTYETHYDVLNVDTTATKGEIKRQFLLLALKFHPDKVSAAERPAAEERFKQLNEAYRVLSDAAARADYDRAGCPDPRSAASARGDKDDDGVMASVPDPSTLTPLESMIGAGADFVPLVSRRYDLVFYTTGLPFSKQEQAALRQRGLERAAAWLATRLDIIVADNRIDEPLVPPPESTPQQPPLASGTLAAKSSSDVDDFDAANSPHPSAATSPPPQSNRQEDRDAAHDSTATAATAPPSSLSSSAANATWKVPDDVRRVIAQLAADDVGGAPSTYLAPSRRLLAVIAQRYAIQAEKYLGRAKLSPAMWLSAMSQRQIASFQHYGNVAGILGTIVGIARRQKTRQQQQLIRGASDGTPAGADARGTPPPGLTLEEQLREQQDVVSILFALLEGDVMETVDSVCQRVLYDEDIHQPSPPPPPPATAAAREAAPPPASTSAAGDAGADPGVSRAIAMLRLAEIMQDVAAGKG